MKLSYSGRGRLTLIERNAPGIRRQCEIYRTMHPNRVYVCMIDHLVIKFAGYVENRAAAIRDAQAFLQHGC